MPAAAVFWPVFLGLSVLAVGFFTYWHELRSSTAREPLGVVVLGPVFVAASLAAFAGEHFTAAPGLAQLVPKWLPGRLFIAYFVGVAHLAAAISFVARRYVKTAAICLASMFALFVLLMDLPGSIAHPATRITWILVARESTFAMGALALFAVMIRDENPELSRMLAKVAGVWTACVLVYYGVDHLLHPHFSPGVPGTMVTAVWVPIPLALAYATGLLLIAFGIVMFVADYAIAGAALSGLLMLGLTLALYVPQFFRANGAGEQVNAINYVFDTLLFAGTLLVIGRAIRPAESSAVATAHRLEMMESRAQSPVS